MIHKTIDGSQSRIEIGFFGDKFGVRKTSSPGGRQEVLDQVAMFQSIPTSLGLHYPTITQAELDIEAPYYEMPYYGWPTFRWLLLHSTLSATQLAPRIEAVVSFLNNVHRPWRSVSRPADYARQTYVDRPLKRLESVRQADSSLDGMLDAPSFRVNGRECLNIYVWFSENADLVSRIVDQNSSQLCFAHGQLEFEHILIDLASPDGFVLLDPRGLHSFLDPCYDLGKMMQSTLGLMDWIEEDLYVLEATAQYSWVLHFALADRVGVANELQRLLEDLAVKTEGEGSSEMAIGSILASISHLASALPFCYASGGPKRALVCMLACGLALEKLLPRLENDVRLKEL